MTSLGSRTRLAALAAAAAGSLLFGALPAGASVTYDTVTNWHSGKCLDVAGASQAAGTVIQQYQCNGSPAQQWTWSAGIGNYAELVVASSGDCMTVLGGTAADGSQVVQEPCTGSAAQQWSLVDVVGQTASGYWWIEDRSGLCLNILSQSLEDRARMEVRHCQTADPGPLYSIDWLFS
jgi:hypothetical protein